MTITTRFKTWLLLTALTICATGSFASCDSNDNQGKVAEITARGTLLVGTTGDYRPLSFCEADGTYWGFGIDVAREIARHLGVGVTFVPTSWSTLIAAGKADVMITEITEAPYYVQTNPLLAAPLLEQPFTHGEIGVLMKREQDDLLQQVNAVIRQMKSDGTLRRLHEKYGLRYVY